MPVPVVKMRTQSQRGQASCLRSPSWKQPSQNANLAPEQMPAPFTGREDETTEGAFLPRISPHPPGPLLDEMLPGAHSPGQWHRTMQVRATFWESDFAAFVLELHFLFSWGLCEASARSPGGEGEWQEG